MIRERVRAEPADEVLGEDAQRTSRRRLLRTGAAAAVGLVALDAANGPKDTLGFGVGATTTILELAGVGVVGQVVGDRNGQQPRHGDQIITIGDLHLGDMKVGEFYATSLYLTRGGYNTQQLAATAEQHTFHLELGTIMGMGTSTHGPEADEFAVVGGTERFARASGTYQALISPYRLGGDATASFRFDLTLEEARRGR